MRVNRLRGPRSGIASIAWALALGGCALPTLFWSETSFKGPLAWETDRAPVVNSCGSLGPFSDVAGGQSCDWAYVDHAGRKIDATADVQKLLDDFMPEVSALRPWMKGADGNPNTDGPAGNHIPYSFHILTVSPVVLLAVPKDPKDVVYCVGEFFKYGCIPSRRFDFGPYKYLDEIKIAEGAFWISPKLGVRWSPVESDGIGAMIRLPDSDLKLTPQGGIWSVSRVPRATDARS